MKLYRTTTGLAIEKDGDIHFFNQVNWDEFVNDDRLFYKMSELLTTSRPSPSGNQQLASELLAPIGSQELWGCGVTYIRSKEGRQEEAKDAGGGDFYARVYEAERPEVFFKSTPHRVVGHGDWVRIRKDSTWDVPEPELTMMVTSGGTIVGYTIGNDMSSRSIEGENPLYLPQAKTYDGCASLGPCLFVDDKPFPTDATIKLHIGRKGRQVFSGDVNINQMRRSHRELVSYVYRACTFPNGSLIMTGTGIVPPNTFTLQSRDDISITIEPIGTLQNSVA